MRRRARAAFFGLFLMASHLALGSLAASAPCDDDAPALPVPSATAHHPGGPQDLQAADDIGQATRQVHQRHCAFCGTGAHHMSHVPALAIASVPLHASPHRSFDTPALVVDRFEIRYDVNLRPPN
jgi:hypothetical protein